MDTALQAIEKMRRRFDETLMAIDHVVAVSTGIGRDGKPCLKIGTSVAPEQVRPKLPTELFQVPVEIDNIGDISAQ